MAYCAKCGAKLPAGSKFCNACGAPVTAARKEKTSASDKVPMICFTVIALALIAAIVVVVPSRIRNAKHADFPVVEASETISSYETNMAQPQTAAASAETEEDTAMQGYEADEEEDIDDFADEDFLEDFEDAAVEDFMWYMAQARYTGSPQGAEQLTDVNDCLRRWKAMILYDPEEEYGSYAEEYVNLWIDRDSVVIDWVKICWPEGVIDERDMEDTELEASWNGTVLTTTGDAEIHIEYFYEYEGKQYALGYLWTESGIPGFVALVRP